MLISNDAKTLQESGYELICNLPPLLGRVVKPLLNSLKSKLSSQKPENDKTKTNETSDAEPKTKPKYETSDTEPKTEPKYETSDAEPKTKPKYETSDTEPKTEPKYETSDVEPKTKQKYETSGAEPKNKTSDQAIDKIDTIINTKCNEQRHAGGLRGGTFNVDTSQSWGTFDISYTTYTVPDAFQVEYEGKVIADIGCVATGGTKERPIWHTKTINYFGHSNNVIVKVNGNCSGSSKGNSTEWAFVVKCPKPECDFASSKDINIQKCFGAIGNQCNDHKPIIHFDKNQETCEIQGGISSGSILHDMCCYRNGGIGVQCGQPGTACSYVWDLAVATTAFYREFIWMGKFGPYYNGAKQGDPVSIESIVSKNPAPDGTYVTNPSYCKSKSYSGKGVIKIGIFLHLPVTYYICGKKKN